MKSKVSFICSFSIYLLCFILFPVIKFLLLVTAAGTAAKTVIEVITTFLCDFSNFTVNVPVDFLPLLANELDKKESLSAHTCDSPIVNQPKQYFSLIYLFCDCLYPYKAIIFHVFFLGHGDFTKKSVILYVETMTSVLSKYIIIYLYIRNV